MWLDYTVRDVHLFLEPPAGISEAELRQGLELDIVKIPGNFIERADEKLNENPLGPGGSAARFLAGRAGPLPLKTIARIESFDSRREFFAAQARSLWNGCFASFDSGMALGLCVDLLIEYELKPALELRSQDERYLFLDCRKRYREALAAARAAHQPEAEAMRLAWERASAQMLLEHGMPEQRMKLIMQEGLGKWSSLADLPGVQFSLRYFPRTFEVDCSQQEPAPPQPKYFYEVRRR